MSADERWQDEVTDGANGEHATKGGSAGMRKAREKNGNQGRKDRPEKGTDQQKAERAAGTGPCPRHVAEKDGGGKGQHRYPPHCRVALGQKTVLVEKGHCQARRQEH